MRMLSSCRRRILAAAGRWVRAHATSPDLPGTLLTVGLSLGCDADLGRLVAGAWGVGILVSAAWTVAAAVSRPSRASRSGGGRAAGRLASRAQSLAHRVARGRVPLALVAAAFCLPGAPLVMGPGPAFLPDWHGAMPLDNCLRTVPLAAWFLFGVAGLQTFVVTGMADGPDASGPSGETPGGAG